MRDFLGNSKCFLLDKVVKLVDGGSVINGAYPVYLYCWVKVKEMEIGGLPIAQGVDFAKGLI